MIEDAHLPDDFDPNAPIYRGPPRGVRKVAAYIPVAGLEEQMEDERPSRTVLQEAQELVFGDRQQNYGDPRDNLRLIAKLWSTYLKVELGGDDVATMMLLLKVARFASGDRRNRDTIVDMAGYIEVLARVLELD